MFADTPLAARIERAEAALSADIGAQVVARGHVPGSFVEPVGGGVAVYAGPASPINKMIGVGFGDGPDAGRLDAIEALYAARGAGVQAEISTLADPAWHAALAPRGYALAGFEHVLGLGLGRPGPKISPGEVPAREIYPGEIMGEILAAEHIVVAACGADEAAVWIDVLVSGFAQPDEVAAQAEGQEYPREAIERVFEDFSGIVGFRRYLARVDGVVAGAGGVREFEGIAQLCGAATLPAFRRRGVQTALLHARLREARRRGCDLAAVTTAPGSKSQQNALRQGFALLYGRALHVKPAPA